MKEQQNNIKLYTFEKEIPVQFSTFPAGEEYVKILKTSNITSNVLFTIIITSADSKTIMRSIMVADAIKKINNKASIVLSADYLPYGRQDRVCNPGESFSLKVFEDIIRTRFDKIVSYDVHSKVSEDIIDIKNILPLKKTFYSIKKEKFDNLKKIKTEQGFDVVVAPDNGAIYRANKFAEFLNIKNTEHLLKNRKNYKIIIDKFISTDFNNYKSAVIFDDICDGGGTFIEAAKIIKKDNPNIKLYLVVSHAIFSKGTDILLEWFDDIFIPKDNFNSKWF